jgi:antitoxin component YwqK of YwqJK toxin-antitoxin module
MTQENIHDIPIEETEDGLSKWFYADNAESLFRELITMNGSINGPFKQYDKDGNLAIRAHFSEGEFHGSYEEFYTNDVCKLLMYFDEGIPIKLIQTRYMTGKIRSKIPLNNQGNRTGWAEEYYPSKRSLTPKLRIKYENGLKHGPIYTFFPDNKPRIKAFFKNDKLDGEYICYHPNNIIKVKCTFQDGILHGQYISNYINGNKMRVMYFQNGQPHGRAFFYGRKTNMVKSSCGFRNGHLHGCFTAFDENNQIITKKLYNLDQLVTTNTAAKVA